jgi:hypothetical protein
MTTIRKTARTVKDIRVLVLGDMNLDTLLAPASAAKGSNVSHRDGVWKRYRHRGGAWFSGRSFRGDHQKPEAR